MQRIVLVRKAALLGRRNALESTNAEHADVLANPHTHRVLVLVLAWPGRLCVCGESEWSARIPPNKRVPRCASPCFLGLRFWVRKATLG